jgi:hypothetical protein
MKHYLLAAFLAAFLAAAPGAAYAHGPLPAAQHGGAVAEASDEHAVELVLNGNQMTVYVMDGSKPVPTAQLAGGKATVLIGGKSQTVVLTSAGANTLTGKLDRAASGKVTSVVTLTVEGKSAQARFTTTYP